MKKITAGILSFILVFGAAAVLPQGSCENSTVIMASAEDTVNYCAMGQIYVQENYDNYTWIGSGEVENAYCSPGEEKIVTWDIPAETKEMMRNWVEDPNPPKIGFQLLNFAIAGQEGKEGSLTASSSKIAIETDDGNIIELAGEDLSNQSLCPKDEGGWWSGQSVDTDWTSAIKNRIGDADYKEFYPTIKKVIVTFKLDSMTPYEDPSTQTDTPYEDPSTQTDFIYESSLIKHPVLSDQPVEDNEISITGYSGSGGDVKIPSQIDGKTVRYIDMNAFRYRNYITNIDIPGTVFGIESYSFENCVALETVNISDGVTTIENQAFAGCINLKKIIIPESVTYLTLEGLPDDCIIVCVKGSAAEEYARNAGLKYDYILNDTTDSDPTESEQKSENDSDSNEQTDNKGKTDSQNSTDNSSDSSPKTGAAASVGAITLCAAAALVATKRKNKSK